MYLAAIIDLHSPCVLNWSLSNSMDAKWCRETLEEAIEMQGKAEIIITDQGSQYTSEVFANYVKSMGIKLSRDGKGRATDNAFIERLWRNIKYEKLYLNPPKDGLDLYLLVQEYFNYYNHERRHQSLNYQIPAQLYENVA